MITQLKLEVKSREEWLATWTEKKAMSLLVAARLRQTKDWRMRKRGERMEACANLVAFHECEDCGTRSVKTATLCRDRVCPICSWRLANKRWVALYSALHSLAGTGISFHFITLTIKNVRPDALSRALSSMSIAWNRLLQRKMVKHYVMGWARSVEITYQKKTGLMHPHYHIIMVTESKLTSEQFDREDIIDYWLKSVRQEGEIVDRKGQDAREIQVRRSDQDLLAAALETYKYTIKQSDLLTMPLLDFVNYARQIAGKRLTATGGVIKDRIKTDLDSIEDEEQDYCPQCGSINLATACMEWAGTTYRII